MPDLRIKRVGLSSRSEVLLNRDKSSNESLTSLEQKSDKVFWIDEKLEELPELLLASSYEKMPEWNNMHEYQKRARSIPDFLAGSNYGYTHEVYMAAAQLFETLAVRRDVGECLVQYAQIPDNPTLPQFETPKCKRQAYELAYETLKYQELLEDILVDSGYFFAHPTNDDATALVVVALFDFQNRKWSPRCRIVGEKMVKEVEEVEDNLMSHRIHLAAALARSRVKNQSLSIDYILPEVVRKQEECASFLPHCGWVNTVKTSLSDVIKALEKHDYVEFKDPGLRLPQHGKYFRVDLQCDDVILFPSDRREALKSLDIVENGSLLLQDKTSSLAVKSVGALLTEDDDCDLIHTDVASGLTTAHLAVILHNVTKKRFAAKELMYGTTRSNYMGGVAFNGSMNLGVPPDDEGAASNKPTVYACGVKSDQHRQELTKLMDKLGLKNVVLLSDKFENIDPSKDSRFEKVKVVLVTPQCTRTAVANPIEFMLNEGDQDYFDILRDLSLGERHKKATESGRHHTETLKFSLKYPSVQAVVYATRSIHSSENEIVINNAINWHKENIVGKRPFVVCPPTLPLSSNDIREDEVIVPANRNRMTSNSNLLKHNFLRMRQSAEMNGCFIAVLSREMNFADSASAKDVLRRAALQGLITPTSLPTFQKKIPKQVGDDVEEEQPGEPHPVEKPIKSKSAHSKKLKTSNNGNHHHQKQKKSNKSNEAVDVDLMLDSYKKKKNAKTDVTNISFEFQTSTRNLHDVKRTTAVKQKEKNPEIENMSSPLTVHDKKR